ncbi:MAG: peroxiredoxin family protein [Planctomycetota bacterium]
MRRLLLGLTASVVAVGCATNERVASIDTRLAMLEASIKFEARLAKVEEVARSQSGTLAVLTESVPALERRVDGLRLELARLERRASKGAAAGPAAKPAMPDGLAIPAGVKHTDAASRKEAWYARRGCGWSFWNRDVGSELFKLYSTGDASGSILKEKDANGVEWKPRDPGTKGQGWDDSKELVGRTLERTRFLNASGRTIDVADYRGKKNVVVVILRGFDPEAGVCIACSGQTLALSQNLDEFEKRDAEVFIVYPGKAETAYKFLDAVSDLQGSTTPLPLELLLDVDLAVVKDFRIEGRLAKPTSIIVDKQGVVQFAHVGRNKTDRPTVPELLKALDRANKK